MSGTLIVSLDFELFWGMTDCCTLEEYKEHVLGARVAIPKLLELFERYGIHATWATVGYMYAENYMELASYFPPDELYPTYCNEKLSTYAQFATIGIDEETAPCFYASSLIRQIAKVKGQELASHTFSHFYCREEGQTVQQFEADMIAAKQIAQTKGYDMTSVVLPRNQCEDAYIDVLRKLGFTAYRDEENDWIHEKVKNRMLMRFLRLVDVYLPLTGMGGYVPQNEGGIWNLVGSRMYKPIIKPLRFLECFKIQRVKSQMLHAAKKGLTFHLWWHPHNVGVMTEQHLEQLKDIFEYYEKLRNKYGMKSLNMHEMTAECNIQSS